MSMREIIRNKIPRLYSNLPKIGKETVIPPGLENMCCEAYNPGPEDVTFDSVHPLWQRFYFFGYPPMFWKKIVCKVGEWVFLPHGCYMTSTPSGRPQQGILNTGDMMFKGNKLPSRPDGPAKIRTFVKR